MLHDSGNGLFIGAFDGATQDILIEGNHIFDNGIENSYYEHNTYTAAIHITYQFNRLGRLRPAAAGNNLKDRSAGLVVRYNWIEDGNRQLDLVDAEDSAVLVNHPDYRRTFVYGNVLVEADGEGNSQIVHYGGDSGDPVGLPQGHPPLLPQHRDVHPLRQHHSDAAVDQRRARGRAGQRGLHHGLRLPPRPAQHLRGHGPARQLVARRLGHESQQL